MRRERVLQEADTMITMYNNQPDKATIRAVAKAIGVSKTTVHKDLREILPSLSSEKSDTVNKILSINKQERYVRGGIAHAKLVKLAK